MSKLLSLLKELDIAKILPEMGTFMGQLNFWVRLILLAGPLVMAGMGAVYFFIPPKEANHSLGYRSRWSMSSVAVWKYAQRLAGMIFMGLGGGMTLVMIIMAIIMGSMEPVTMAMTALICAIVEAILTVAAWIVIEVLLRKYYDQYGDPRK